MSRTRPLIAALALLLLIASPTLAAKPATRGFLPPGSGVHGRSITDIATEWALWAMNGPLEENPLFNVTCEQSPSDPKLWFLPVTLGISDSMTCDVPTGAFILASPGGYECSEAEGNGSTAAELTACLDEFFPLLDYAEVTLDGRRSNELGGYVVTTPVYQLDAGNVWSDNATPSIDRGYFLLLHPMSRGTHELRLYDEFSAFDFAAGIDITINVH